MGNICQDQNIAALPTLENGDTTKIGSYNVVDWPEDDFFIHKVDELRTKSGNRIDIQNLGRILKEKS
jgi:hypothetical protein